MGPQSFYGKKIEWPRGICPRRALFCLGILFLPCLVNLGVWYSFVTPLEKKVADLRSLAAFVELKPRMETLVADNNEIMARRVPKGVLVSDAGGVLKELQELANIHKIEVKELLIQNEEAGPESVADKELAAAGIRTASLSLDAIGSYSKLARWLASIDQKMEVRLRHLTLTPFPFTGKCQLRLELNILLRNP